MEREGVDGERPLTLQTYSRVPRLGHGKLKINSWQKPASKGFSTMMRYLVQNMKTLTSDDHANRMHVSIGILGD